MRDGRAGALAVRVTGAAAAALLLAPVTGCGPAQAPAAVPPSPGPAAPSSGDPFAGRPTVVEVEGLGPFAVEVADDPPARRTGLMGRERVPPATGMLFVFDEADTRTFWMKDTFVPLDIAWIRDGRVVGVDTMRPCVDRADCPSHRSPGPVDAALEVAAGGLDAAEPGATVTVREVEPGSGSDDRDGR